MTLISDDKAPEVQNHMIWQNHDAIQELERVGGFFLESESDARAMWQQGVRQLQQALLMQFLGYAERMCDGDHADAAMSLGIPLNKAEHLAAVASGA